jgi:3-hydroxybutyryl-CoA dehydratase
VGVAAEKSGVIASVGIELPRYRVEFVNPASMREWAVFLRDPNPIHLDARAVQAKGLGDTVINQGVANLAYVIVMLQVAFPDSALRALDVRYVGSVFGGDAVEAGGKVTEVVTAGAAEQIRCDVWLRADARDVVISGSAVVDRGVPISR